MYVIGIMYLCSDIEMLTGVDSGPSRAEAVRVSRRDYFLFSEMQHPIVDK